MLLETLINPKPKTTVYFAVISFLFLAIPSLEVSLVNSYSEFSYPYLIFFSSILILLLHAFGLNNLIYNNNIIKKENLIYYQSTCLKAKNKSGNYFVQETI